ELCVDCVPSLCRLPLRVVECVGDLRSVRGALRRWLTVQRRDTCEEIGICLLTSLRLRGRPLSHVPIDLVAAGNVRCGPRLCIRAHTVKLGVVPGSVSKAALRVGLEGVEGHPAR